ncbi:MAG: WYL domain-containing protein [Gemmatimonadaceae bacterium]|nr:WYL domain-containing protein [Gemmatimonadaceae bacterium]
MILAVLDDALQRHKTVRLTYRSNEHGVVSRRDVSPYGLLMLRGRWFLVALDNRASAVRHFRVSRISRAVVSVRNAQRADFDVPSDFDIRDLSEERRAWELGDGRPISSVVEFDFSDAVAARGAELGERLTSGRASSRRFAVRRPESFVRWLLAFAGAARPISPHAIVSAWRAAAKDAYANYASADRGES